MKQQDDKALMEVLEKYGPVAVAIDASDPKFQSYSTQIYKPDSWSITNIGFKHLLIYNYFLKKKLFFLILSVL